MSETKILVAATECFPYARTGGLAEVIPALSTALNNLKDSSFEIAIVIPFYGFISKNFHQAKTFKKTSFSSDISMGDRTYTGELYQTILDGGVKLFLVKNDYYFNRHGIYGDEDGDYKDNNERFYFFNRFVVDMVKEGAFKTELIHIHDWHVSLIPGIIKSACKNDPKINHLKTLLTIHNLGYQGVLKDNFLKWGNFDFNDFPESIFGKLNSYHTKLNFLKTGIVFADSVNTVSPNYAKEIQTSEYGFGLEQILENRKSKLSGILNGVDYRNWDPKTDSMIPANYSSTDIANKQKCKKRLCEKFGFEYDPDVPIISSVTRLTYQKGMDLLISVWNEFKDLDMKFIILGDGDKELENFFLSHADEYPEKIAASLKYDIEQSHLIQAGSDMLLMPSRYEPCGLSQLYAMKYGTVPIVRATGGLEDTVIDLEENDKKGTGFKFRDFSGYALMEKTKKALEAFKNKENWNLTVKRIMEQDFSYQVAAEKYAKLYRKLI